MQKNAAHTFGNMRQLPKTVATVTIHTAPITPVC